MLKHPVETAIKDFAVLLKEFDEEELSEPHDMQFARIKASTRFIRGALRLADPTVAPTAQLNTLQSNLSQAETQIAAFVSNKNPAHITNAFNQIEAAVTTAQALPTVGRRPNAEKLAEAIERFVESTDELVERTQRDQEELSVKADDIDNHIEKMSAELEALRQGVKAQEARLDNISSEFQSQFSEAQESRVNKFQEFRDAKLQEFADLLDQTEEMLNQKDKDFSATAKRALSELKRRERQAQDRV